MKEGGDWSGERQRPHGRISSEDRSIIPECASLPPELVERIAVLSTATCSGVDTYMDMRAVCSSWRSAIARPSALQAVADVRFRPRHWVMVDLKSRDADDSGARLLRHAPTGRFRRLRLPVLRDHTVLGASDGLLVLRDMKHIDLHRILNPLTGDMLHLTAPLQEHFGDGYKMITAVSGGSHPTLVLWWEREWRWETVVYADPTSDKFTEEYIGTWLATMNTFQGNIYYAGPDGDVFKFVAPAEPCNHELKQCRHELIVVAELSLDVDICVGGDYSMDVSSYLVESAGKLLLVRQWGQALKIFRVDVEHNMLQEVRSLGGCRALFLGDERCVSVEADKLPSVEGDCVYISDMSYWAGSSEHRGRVYNLRDGTMEIISSEKTFRTDNSRLRPLSLIQVLLTTAVALPCSIQNEDVTINPVCIFVLAHIDPRS